MSETTTNTTTVETDKTESLAKQQKNVDELLEWYEKKDLGLI